VSLFGGDFFTLQLAKVERRDDYHKLKFKGCGKMFVLVGQEVKQS